MKIVGSTRSWARAGLFLILWMLAIITEVTTPFLETALAVAVLLGLLEAALIFLAMIWLANRLSGPGR